MDRLNECDISQSSHNLFKLLQGNIPWKHGQVLGVELQMLCGASCRIQNPSSLEQVLVSLLLSSARATVLWDSAFSRDQLTASAPAGEAEQGLPGELTALRKTGNKQQGQGMTPV